MAHLIERHDDGDLVDAVRAAANELEGHFAFVVMHDDHPGVLVATRRQCPLVIGEGDGECFIASNAAAFLTETRLATVPEDGDVVVVTRRRHGHLRRRRVAVFREQVELEPFDGPVGRAGYESFMLKEIHEQPGASRRRIRGRLREGKVELEGFDLSDDELRKLRRIVIVSAGTSYHAGVVARYALEQWARHHRRARHRE